MKGNSKMVFVIITALAIIITILVMNIFLRNQQISQYERYQQCQGLVGFLCGAQDFVGGISRFFASIGNFIILILVLVAIIAVAYVIIKFKK